VDIVLEGIEEGSLVRINGESVNVSDNIITLILEDGINEFKIEQEDQAGNTSDLIAYSPVALLGNNYEEVTCPGYFSFLIDSTAYQIGLAKNPRIPSGDLMAEQTQRGYCELLLDDLSRASEPGYRGVIYHVYEKGKTFSCTSCGEFIKPAVTVLKIRELPAELQAEIDRDNAEFLYEEKEHTNSQGVTGKLIKRVPKNGTQKIEDAEYYIFSFEYPDIGEVRIIYDESNDNYKEIFKLVVETISFE
jgi:hypothetical protein